MKESFYILTITGIIMVLGAITFSCQNPKIEAAEIKVASVICGSCTNTLKNALKAIEGVREVNVDLERKIASVQYNPSKTSISELEFAIMKSGYDANDKPADKNAYENLPGCCKVKKEKSKLEQEDKRL